jgi:3-hydroxybutyryl-CoA dehydrogenase
MEEEIRKVAIIGAGTMGAQIGPLAASFGYEVVIYDRDESAFDKGLENVKDLIKKSKKVPTIPVKEWDKGIKKTKLCRHLEEAIENADLVIEAIPEELELKRVVFGQLDGLAPQNAILATNSSSIPISKIESATGRPEQCLNIHFYIPAMGLNMVDIMGGSKTTEETMRTGKEWIRSIGCVPLTVNKETLGFCFNRVWRAVKRETLYLWAEEYVDFRDIDRGWMIFTGMSMGPFGLMDSIGLDVVYNIEMVYYDDSQDPKDRPPDALKAMLDRNELGVKTGKGFYAYPNPEFSRPAFITG